MSDADLRTREDAMLARAAELCLSLAEHLHAEVLTAEPADKSALTKAMHTALRSLRQSIALRRRVERENRDVAGKAEKEALTRHKARIRAPIAWQIWNEYETADAALSAEMDLDEVLNEAVLDDDFLTIPVQQHITTLCRAMDIAIPQPLSGEPIRPPPLEKDGVGREPDG